MKVAIVTESFLPQINGVTNSVLRILESLGAGGHEALVVVPESVGTPKEYAGHKVKTIPALPIQSVIPIGLPIGLPNRRLEHLIDGFSPDLLHLASPMLLGMHAAKVAKKLNIPTLSVYQTDMAGFASHYGFDIAHSSLRKLVGKIHSQTDRTLAPSKSACIQLTSLGVSEVYLWQRGVNNELFNPKARSEALRKYWDPTGKRTIIGYVGRLAKEKRISDLRYLDRDPSNLLIITGDGPAKEKLKRDLPNAIFMGHKNGGDLAEIFASLDLFIHPGPNETFCQAVQEALSSGTPCIVPRTGGPADLVRHGKTGYVINIHRPDELESTVLHFKLRNDQVNMALQARQSVLNRTWATINAQLINHYEEILIRHRDYVDGSVA
ncbi:MAG: glycosyltransferase family 1 protein [Actinomycetota bacterium]|nr:glycosyltransferase family 1 protein [Actinomycetota bacterium]MDA2996826.1 glycosyltransferase family 1 protein [Actinomycetota bacterium]